MFYQFPYFGEITRDKKIMWQEISEEPYNDDSSPSR